jgi:hypothetical protein
LLKSTVTERPCALFSCCAISQRSGGKQLAIVGMKYNDSWEWLVWPWSETALLYAVVTLGSFQRHETLFCKLPPLRKQQKVNRA